MRILGIDYGQARTGIAITDSLNIEYALRCDQQYYKQLKRKMLDIIENNIKKIR